MDSPVKREVNGISKVQISEENKALVKSILSDKNTEMQGGPRVTDHASRPHQDYKVNNLLGIQEWKGNAISESRLQEQKAFLGLNAKPKDHKVNVITDNQQWKHQFYDKQQVSKHSVMDNKRPGGQDAPLRTKTDLKDGEGRFQSVHVSAIVRNSSVNQPPKLVEARKPPLPHAKEQLLLKKPNNTTPPMPKLVKIAETADSLPQRVQAHWNHRMEKISDIEAGCDSDDSEDCVRVIQHKRPNGKLHLARDGYMKHESMHPAMSNQDLYYKQEKPKQMYMDLAPRSLDATRTGEIHVVHRETALAEHLVKRESS